jgi:hypothetical protein
VLSAVQISQRAFLIFVDVFNRLVPPVLPFDSAFQDVGHDAFLVELFERMSAPDALKVFVSVGSYYIGEGPHEIFDCLMLEKGADVARKARIETIVSLTTSASRTWSRTAYVDGLGSVAKAATVPTLFCQSSRTPGQKAKMSNNFTVHSRTTRLMFKQSHFRDEAFVQ